MRSRFDGPLGTAIAGEVAASLGISGRRLRIALEALRIFDESVQGQPVLRGQAAARARLVAEAAEACWGFIVQRELLGMGREDPEYVRRQYDVPAEVWAKLGPKKRR